MTGKGTWKGNNGMIVTGNFKDGYLHGYGEKSITGSWKHAGYWENGKKEGHGEWEIYKCPNDMDIKLVETKVIGEVTTVGNFGVKYVGNWHADQMDS